jgi:hypothetical protein
MCARSLFVDTNNCAQGRRLYSHTPSTYGSNRTLTSWLGSELRKYSILALFIRIRMTNRGLTFSGSPQPTRCPFATGSFQMGARSRGVMKQGPRPERIAASASATLADPHFKTRLCQQSLKPAGISGRLHSHSHVDSPQLQFSIEPLGLPIAVVQWPFGNPVRLTPCGTWIALDVA